jgi:hypothetical protein
MRVTWFLALGLAALVAAAGAPGTALAQCRLCGTPTTRAPESLSNEDVKLDVQTTLDFDRLILLGAGQGVAVIRPDGSSSSTGSLGNIGPRAMVGSVAVHGQPGRILRIDIPRRIELYSLSGSQIDFDDLQSDLPSIPRLDSAGNLIFHFGGRLRITGDADGDYRGDLPITVEYQ